MTQSQEPQSRRQWFTMIGRLAGGAAMYQAMAALGHAAQSPFVGRPNLSGAKPGSSVIVLGAGMAGLVAAYELRQAGYKVQVLEYEDRPGGRAWTLRGGDKVRESDGSVQTVRFAKGNYFNPGPWRVPYHHHAMLDYYKHFKVLLEPFMQVNYNAYVHNSKALRGTPQRFRHVQADVRGHVSELLSKATRQGALDETVTKEDQERLLASLRNWGPLNRENRYVQGTAVSDRRGYDVDPGGGLMPLAKPSQPIGLSELMQSNLWALIGLGDWYEFQSTIFQPVGGMDVLPMAIAKELGNAIHYNCKVLKISQDTDTVTVTYEDARAPSGNRQAIADWCVCTIPASILSQLDIACSKEMKEAIAALPYGGAVKVGLEFNRRFWEEDDGIYGGCSYTDLPVQTLSYPSNGYQSDGPAVMLGAYAFENTNSYRWSSLAPAERIRLALEYGSQLHPQYRKEFRSGVTVAWHRMPWVNGCFGAWTESMREKHYKALAQIDGRLVLAGEHVSYIPAWQEGSVLSSLDAISRLHAKAKVA